MMDLNLDMDKAYDRVEWSFVVRVLSVMGFSENMVSLIKRCISSVSYQVLINGNLTKCFSQRRASVKETLSPLTCLLLCRCSIGATEEEGHGW